jgi:Putative transposase/Transposase zinc-binding domain
MRPKLEVADIFRHHGDAFRAAQGKSLSHDQRKVMAAIESCRTPALGGHVERCEDCGATRIAYNSCRDRHCPKCQGLARLQWLADRRTEMLPVPYFHVVFTVPAPIAAIALQNKAVVYDILFKAAAQTIRDIAADPKYLGAETGMIAILLTWGQTLTHHPHVHCIVPGGGLGPDGRWVGCKPNFFLPVHALSRCYRRLFLERLRTAFDAGDLSFHGELARLRDPAEIARYLKPVTNVPWVVFAKPPFAGPSQILDYLGRYTHRVAIANGRLLGCEADRVTFRWKILWGGGQRPTLCQSEVANHPLWRRSCKPKLPTPNRRPPSQPILPRFSSLWNLAARSGSSLRCHRALARRCRSILCEPGTLRGCWRGFRS